MSGVLPWLLIHREERLSGLPSERWGSKRGDPEPETVAAEDAGMSGRDSVLPLPGPNILVLREESTVL
jgi:hypothetical protein